MKNLTYITLLFFACQNEPVKPVQTNFVDVEFSESFDEKQETSWSRLAVDATASPSSIVGTAEQYVDVYGNGFVDQKGRIYFGSYFTYGGQIPTWEDTYANSQVPLTNTGNYTVYVKANDGTTLATANSVSVKWGVYKVSASDGLGSYKLYPIKLADTNGDAPGFRTYHCKIGTPLSFKNTIQQAFDYIYQETGLLMILGDDLDVATTGNRTITVNIASATNLAMGGAVFTGTKTSAVLDHSATNSGTGVPTVNFSSTASDSVLICAFGTAENDTYGTWGTGQTEFADVAQGGGPSNRVSVGGSYEIVNVSGGNNQTLSGGGINAWGGVAVEFLAFVAPLPNNNKRIITIN